MDIVDHMLPGLLRDIFLWKETEFCLVQYVLYISVLVVLECLQVGRGKLILTEALPSLILFCGTLFICHVYEAYAFVTFIILLYEGLETASWYSVDSGISFRFLSALDLSYALWMVPLWVSLLCVGLILLIGFTFFPFMGFTINVSRWCAVGVLLLAMISIPFVVEEKLDTLYPFRDSSTIMTPSYERVNTSFHGPWDAKLKPGAHKKNLILLEIESLESKAIGKFNSLYPKSMPYLSSLTNNTMYFTNIKQQPYNSWSAAGMFVVQCGFPLITNDVSWGVRKKGGFERFEPIKCIPDLLRMIVYKLYGFCSQSCDIMNMKSFLVSRGYLMQDSKEHNLQGDGPLFEMLKTKVLPQLKAQNEPFVMLVITDDTHFSEQVISPECDDYLAREDYPRILRSYTCVDQMIHKFVDRVKELGMDNNTEIIVFGDHFTMSRDKFFRSESERSLSVFFPLHGQDEGWRIGNSKELTYYDMAPTIMDLLNVEYSPPFPFGSSIIRPGKGSAPDTNDLKQIYRIITGSDTLRRVHCRGKRGFCQGGEN